jgi:hypothetical protein
MHFASDLLGETWSLSLASTAVQGKVGRAVQYSQVVTGSMGGRNRSITRIHVEYWGSAKGTAGNAQFWFLLETPIGRYEYVANASLASVTLAEDGSAVYRFTGWYALNAGPATAGAIMPHEGKITLTLDFWSDGSLYASDIELVEVP